MQLQLGDEGLGERVCAVCDSLVLKSESKCYKLCEMPPNQCAAPLSAPLARMRRRLGVPDGSQIPEAMRSYYNVSDLSPLLDGMLLSRVGIYPPSENEPLVTICICDQCNTSLHKGNADSKTPPKFSIANGLWIAQLPEELRKLEPTRTDRFGGVSW